MPSPRSEGNALGEGQGIRPLGRIPLLRPRVPPLYEAHNYYQQATLSGQFSNAGACWRSAQEMLSKRLSRMALPVTNGTVAIEVALQALLKRGSRVAICDFTFIAQLSAVTRAGMTPVLVGADPDRWTIDPKTLYNYSQEFDAFIVTVPFGYQVQTKLYDELSEMLGKPVIYDCAGGFGMEMNTPAPVCYSFHATKNLGIGEGGAVVFSREEHYDRAFRLINFDLTEQKQPMSQWGMNGKLDELRSAMLVAALKDEAGLRQRIESRRSLICQYQDDLRGIVEGDDKHLYGAAPQLAVFRTPFTEALMLCGPQEQIEFRRYYAPVLSKVQWRTSILCVSQSPDYFDEFIAFPSDPTGNEYMRVVEFIQRIAQYGETAIKR